MQDFRNDRRAAIKRLFRVRVKQGYVGSFVDFWREYNDSEVAKRFAADQKRSLSRRQK